MRAQEEKRQKALSKSRGSNTVMDPKYDDEYYVVKEDPNQLAENNDDYYKFQDSINKSLSSFKYYNEKLQNYFMKTRERDAPDKYDSRILVPDNDDW